MAICGNPNEEEELRFLNMFHEAVAPAMRTPRDVTRFANALSVSWPAVEGEVNTADFLALEVMRLFHPLMHRAIRQNKALMCEGSAGGHGDREAFAERLRNLLLGSKPEIDESRLRGLVAHLCRKLPQKASIRVSQCVAGTRPGARITGSAKA